MSTKRLFDTLAVLAALPLVLPLIAAIAAVTRILLGSPIMFVQNRPGYEGTPFRLYKFRTMTDHRDVSGKVLSDAQRLTKFGRFLRTTSLDELPELFNVIRGDMSLVGPRPLLMQYLERYSPEQMRRHEVKPGITGWAQINGRNGITWEEKFALDVWYVDHQSFMLDLRILIKTIWKVIVRQNVNQQGQATAREFYPTDNNSGTHNAD